MTDQLCIVAEHLAAGMRDEATGLSPSRDLIAGATRGYRRRRALLGTGVATGLAAVLALGVALRASPPHPSTPVAGQGRVALAAAMEASGDTSFALDLAYVRVQRGHSDTDRYTGAYDGRGRVGYLRFNKAPLQVVVVGDDLYVVETGQKYPRAHFTGPVSRALAIDTATVGPAFDDLSVDPKVLFANLQRLGGAQYVGRSGGLDTYRFRFQVPGDDRMAAHTISGSIAVHVDSGLLARVAQETTVVGADPTLADREPLTFRTVMTFSHYGIAVHVTRPPTR